MSNFNLPNIPIACGPTIEFAFHGDVCTAELAGAKLRAESTAPPRGARPSTRLTRSHRLS